MDFPYQSLNEKLKTCTIGRVMALTSDAKCVSCWRERTCHLEAIKEGILFIDYNDEKTQYFDSLTLGW